jgi:nucleotide-binding universal stress UspA family protein
MSSAALSEIEAARIREDALKQQANQPHAGEAISGTRGRVEEETRRLSEQMTREAQEQRKAQALAQTAPLTPPTPAFAQTAPLTPPMGFVRRLPDPIPIRSTLVALDGGVFAERALPYAAALARLTGSALTVGSCAQPEGSADEGVIEEVNERGGGTLPLTSQALRQTLLAARDRLRDSGLTAEARIVSASDVAEGLLALGKDVGADALALATHARGGMERIVLGSVADAVVRGGRGLTLVTPPLAPDGGAENVSFTRVLAPLDGSTLSEETLRVIQPLLQRDVVGDESRALRTLTLFFVADDQVQLKDAEVYLHDLREALLRVTTAPTEITTQVVVGSAPGAIVARAAGKHPEASGDERYDLIIMATHGRGGLGRWFSGSVATYALAHSEVPVLLVRSAE